MRNMLYLAAVFALAGCGGGTSYSGMTAPPQVSPSPPVMTTSVSLRNLAFNPSAIQVAPGATVQFTNNDGIEHNITFSASAVSAPFNFSSGVRSVVMPTTTGTYAYHCSIHAGMAGTITVQ
jgi:plastocyanin